MNKEFIGKKKFYLDDNPDKNLIVRIYVVETRQNEYLTAVLENGDAFQIEEFEGPKGVRVKSYIDFENNQYCEYPTVSATNVKFFNRNSDEIGIGDVSMIKIGSDRYFMGGFTTTRSFKYKRCGWDYKVQSGENLTCELDINSSDSTKAFSWDDFVEKGKVSEEFLENKEYQIWCRLPLIMRNKI